MSYLDGSPFQLTRLISFFHPFEEVDKVVIVFSTEKVNFDIFIASLEDLQYSAQLAKVL